MVEEIIENSGTPYFSFKDIDENKADRVDQDPRRDHRLLPASATGRTWSATPQKRETIEERLAELERQLRAEAGGNLAGVRR